MRYPLMVINAVILFVPLVYTLIVGLITYYTGRLIRLSKTKQYGFNLLVGVDQMANVILQGFPDETISSRTGRAIVTGEAKWYIRVWRHILDKGARLFGDAPEHARRAIEHERNFHKQPELWRWSNRKIR